MTLAKPGPCSHVVGFGQRERKVIGSSLQMPQRLRVRYVGLGFLLANLRFLGNLLDYADGDGAAHVAYGEAA